MAYQRRLLCVFLDQNTQSLRLRRRFWWKFKFSVNESNTVNERLTAESLREPHEWKLISGATTLISISLWSMFESDRGRQPTTSRWNH